MGIILYELCTGDLPSNEYNPKGSNHKFDSAQIMELFPHKRYTKRVAGILEMCLTEDVSKRTDVMKLIKTPKIHEAIVGMVKDE